MTDLSDRESPTRGSRTASGSATWVIFFSATPWHGGAHRQHALARQLATSYRVIFVDPPGLRIRTGTSIRRVEHHIWHAELPTAAPLGRHLPAANAINRRVTVAVLRRWLHRDPAGVSLIWLDEDLAAACASRIDAAAVVYDVTDLDWTFTRRWNRRHLRRNLDRAVSAADLVLASSAALPARMPAGRQTPVVLPNACDPEHFTPQGPTVSRPVEPGRPLIGYSGTIDTRAFDGELVAEVARNRPDWTFLLIGPSTRAGRKPLAGLTNVLVTGPVPYAELPATLRVCDVTIIPYRLGGLVDYVHPKKCYEYLALGKPVVATPLPALTGLTGVVRLAARAEDFTAAITATLTETTDPEQAAHRRAVATANSWSVRGEHLHRLVAGLLR
ncbi:glycosyltransferase [Verrucosispora sp. WMMD573]|uniref:glycosyltransferase n=1 Tax=Verrucosispora sp. WMMD573 TaxID=3015149 RepID=UPI00248CB2DB|nr:glycosyltransferase [Verrucosispora sp. WMMD573]WBB53684.1 glycosyltransferase [Verrucosispora sp. WMMD573]